MDQQVIDAPEAIAEVVDAPTPAPEPKPIDNGDDLVIWLAGPADVDEVMNIAIMASEENGLVRAAPGRLLNDIWPALNLDHGMMGAIGKPGGRIEGVILLRIGALWYSEENVLEEKAIFIHPDFRSAKGGRMRKFCDFAKATSDRLGLPLVIGVLSDERTVAKVRTYQKVFGPPAGAFFVYRPKGGEPAEAGT